MALAEIMRLFPVKGVAMTLSDMLANTTSGKFRFSNDPAERPLTVCSGPDAGHVSDLGVLTIKDTYTENFLVVHALLPGGAVCTFWHSFSYIDFYLFKEVHNKYV